MNTLARFILDTSKDAYTSLVHIMDTEFSKSVYLLRAEGDALDRQIKKFMGTVGALHRRYAEAQGPDGKVWQFPYAADGAVQVVRNHVRGSVEWVRLPHAKHKLHDEILALDVFLETDGERFYAHSLKDYLDESRARIAGVPCKETVRSWRY